MGGFIYCSVKSYNLLYLIKNIADFRATETMETLKTKKRIFSKVSSYLSKQLSLKSIVIQNIIFNSADII